MKLKKYLLAFAFILSVSGCLNYHQEVSFNSDGSGSMKIHYWMKIEDNSKLSLVTHVGIFNPDTLRSQFTHTAILLEDIIVYSDTTDSTTHAIVELSFKVIDSLNSTKPFADANFSMRDGAAGQKIFSQFIPPIATGFDFDNAQFKVSYDYYFPGEIITHNAHRVDGKNLIWEYNLSEIGKGKNISVTFRPHKLEKTPYWIYVLMGIVLLSVVFFLFRKKR